MNYNFYAILFTVIYVIYHLTLLPSVPGGDSGELLANACLGSTSHPPGYPLFTLMSIAANFCTFIPRVYLEDNFYPRIDLHPTFGWKVNHQCACLSALTAILVGMSSRLLLCSIIGKESANQNQSKLSITSGLGAILYAFSPLIWEYSAQSAEVFALNNLLCCSLIYLTCKVYECVNDDKTSNTSSFISKRTLSTALNYTYCGAFIAGLAAANQHASSLFIMCLIPAVLICILPAIYQQFRWVELIIGSGFSFFVGVSPYFHLWYNASYNTKPGGWGNLDSVQGFLTHILRKEYGTFKMGAERKDIEGFVERLRMYISHANRETFYFVFPLALVAIIFSLYKFLVLTKRTKNVSLQQLNQQSQTDNKINHKPRTSKKNKKVIKKETIEPSKESNFIQPPAEIEKCNIALMLCLFSTYIFYVLVWHGVLSNLPLSAPMPFVVHSRFWIQPHILLCIFAGTGMGILFYLLERSKAMPSIIVSNFAQYAFTCIFFAFIVSQRFIAMDRSKSGWIMNAYAEELVNSIPSNSLLLSHTDLNWNPLRYLSECESYNSNPKSPISTISSRKVTHLNFQMVAYPWFSRKQKPLYPHVKFPRVDYPGISTNRLEEGNAVLVRNMLIANGIEFHTPENASFTSNKNLKFDSRFPGGIYLDMQSVNEVEIGDIGQWRGLTLLPYGLTYRVLGPLKNIRDIDRLHAASIQQLDLLRSNFGKLTYRAFYHLEEKEKYTRYTDGIYVESESVTNVYPQRNSNPLYRQYPEGSWEFAAISVYYDSQYQLGLSILTYAIELQKNADLKLLPILVDRLYIAAQLLEECQSNVFLYGTISSSKSDLYKNSAMGWMRLSGLLIVSQQFKSELMKLVQTVELHKEFLYSNTLDLITNHDKYIEILTSAKRIIEKWANDNNNDADIEAFRKSLIQIEEQVIEAPSKSKGGT